MKSWGRCLIIAMAWGLGYSLIYLQSTGDLLFSDIIIQFSFSYVRFDIAQLIDMTMRFLPFILFQICYGALIYHHLCSASIYYFSRCSNRFEWFLKESFVLYLYALVYVIVIVLSATVVASINHSIIIDKASIILFTYYVLIHSGWLFFSTLMINILAVKLNSNVAFSIICSVQTICMFGFRLWDELLPLKVERNVWLLKFNPISHLVLSWHSSKIFEVNQRIFDYNLDFDLNISVITMLILSITTVVLGGVIVKKHDLIIFNAESGGSL